MGPVSFSKPRILRRTPACILLACIAGAVSAEDKPKPHFARERPKLRPLFGSVHEEGVEPNKFNDGGQITIQKFAPFAPKKSADALGFNPDPGGVTPDPKADWQAPG